MRLSYGLKVAAALIAGGTAIYYAVGPRSTMTAPDIVELMEGINERRAAVGTWPFTGNTNDGWSFTTFTNLGAVLPHAAMKQIMDEQRNLATNFVEWVSNNVPIMYTAPRLFQACGVGPADGTQTLYTVGILTNGVPVYSNVPWATAWTGLLWECYRLQVAMTSTVRTVTSITANRKEYNPDFAITNYIYMESDAQYFGWPPEYEIPWYSNAFFHHHYDDVPDETFQSMRGVDVSDFPATNVAFHPTNYSASFDSCRFIGAYLDRNDGDRFSGGVYSDTYWRADASVYADDQWRKTAVCSNLIWFASFPSGVLAQARFFMLTTGSVSVVLAYQSTSGGGEETIYSNLFYSIASNSIQESSAYSFSDISTAAIPVGVSVPASLEMAFPDFDTASWVGHDATSNGVYRPKITGTIQNVSTQAVINWTFTRCRP